MYIKKNTEDEIVYFDSPRAMARSISKPRSRKRVRTYDTKSISVEAIANALIKPVLLCCIFMMIVLGTVLYLEHQKNIELTKNYYNLSASYNEQKEQLATTQTKLNNMVNKYNSSAETIAGLTSVNDQLTEEATKFTTAMQTLEDQNKSLADSNEEYYNELAKFKKRSELYNKYEYAVIDPWGNRTDLTYDQLDTAESAMKDAGIDPDLLFSLVMIESNGTEKAKNSSSTAKGYCQLLNGTAKSMYKMAYGTTSGYYPNITLDGDTNLTLGVELLSYLKQHNSSVYAMVDGYRGYCDTAYNNKLNSFLAKGGTSLAKINSELY